MFSAFCFGKYQIFCSRLNTSFHHHTPFQQCILLMHRGNPNIRGIKQGRSMRHMSNPPYLAEKRLQHLKKVSAFSGGHAFISASTEL